MVDRIVSIEKPGYLTTEYQRNHTKCQGRAPTARNSQPCRHPLSVNDLGGQIKTGLDINANGVLDYASLDRITHTETGFVEIGDAWWQETVQRVLAGDNDPATTTTGTSPCIMNRIAT